MSNITQTTTPRQPSKYPCPIIVQDTLYIAVRQHPGGQWFFDQSLTGSTAEEVWEAADSHDLTGLGRLDRQVAGPVISVVRASLAATVHPSRCRDIPELTSGPLLVGGVV